MNQEILGSLDLPHVKCKSFRSKLFHEKMVCELVAKFMNQLELRKSLNQIKKLGYDKEISELPDKTKKIAKVIEKARNKLSAQQELLEHRQENSEKKDLIIQNPKSEVANKKSKNQDLAESNLKWPGIYVYLVKDRASICLILNKLSLHKHGFRKYISWGPIKETLISGCLAELNFIENCRKYFLFFHFE